jgi:hypothetical protein
MKAFESPDVSSAGVCPHGNDRDACALCREAELIESDHRFDVVEGGMGMRRIEKLGLKERLGTPEERRELFANLNDEQYKKMLGYVNSLVRGEKISYEYGDSAPPTLVVPKREMKDPLLRETFAAVRELLADGNSNPEEALRLAGLMMAGAVNYIHPYDDGNGRVGRILHYLMEFGTERGEALNDELRALIAKTPLYEGDSAQVIDDTPPTELERSLYIAAAERDPGFRALDAREKAADSVRMFLKMMKGDVAVPIMDEVVIVCRQRKAEQWKREKCPAGSIDGRTLYLREYEAASTAPNRGPDQMPSAEPLTNIRRDDRDAEKYVNLPFDLV